MKKQISLFTIILAISFVFISCSMFEKNIYDETASVSFEVPARLIKNILRNTDDEFKEKRNIYIDVKLTGDYTDSSSIVLSYTPDWESEKNPEAEKDSLITSQKISFDSVPVGSTVKVDVEISMSMSFGEEESEKEKIYKGTSESIIVKEGENIINIKLKYNFGEEEEDNRTLVSFTLDFSNTDKPFSLQKFYSIYVMALKKDSELVDEFIERFADGKGNTDDIDYFTNKINSSDCAGYSYWSDGLDTYNTFKISDNKLILSSDFNFIQDEELVFVAFASMKALNENLAPYGVPYIAYSDSSTIETVNDSAIIPPEEGDVAVLKASTVAQAPMYALYDGLHSSSVWDIHLTRNLQSAPVTISNICDFAFDNNCYLHVLDNYGKIKSYRGEVDVTSFDNGEIQIRIDSATNIMYGFFGDSDTCSIYKFNNYISDGSVEENTVTKYEFDASKFNSLKSSTDLSETASIGFSNDLAIVHDGVLYAYGGSSTSLTTGFLYKIDLKEDNPSPEFVTKGSMFGIADDDVSLHVNDLIYMDNAIYLLVCYKRSDVSGIASCGAVVKYDIVSDNATNLGYSSAKTYSQEESLKAACFYEGDEYYKAYDSSTNSRFVTSFWFATGQEYHIKAPYENEDSYFVGPQRFIAVKPKKLVISDSGYAFYTNENEQDAISKKKINRVVELDLENLSMANASLTNVSVKFDNDFQVIQEAPEHFESIKRTISCGAGEYYYLNGNVKTDIPSGDQVFYPYFIEE